jgi:hypothetical protein
MRRVIGVADWTQLPTERTYHWLYEAFLEAYDPQLRKRTGAYYTPAQVADFMTRLIDEVLQKKLHVERGLANDNVVVLDPAMGTGTFLQSTLDRVAEAVRAEQGDVPASLRALLARLIGFERQIGPFAVAELKLDQALDSHDAEAKDEDFRLYVTDTLDDPNKAPLSRHSKPYDPLAKSRLASNKVKTDEPVMVVLGNPPYRTHAKPYGKWIVNSPLLDGFRLPGNGKQEYQLHDLAIYFWRWSLWKAFESSADQPAGVVAFITTRAYLTGPGFAGMRRYLRRHADFGWIIDVSPEGHHSSVATRVFAGVPHPVCIGIFARGDTPDLEEPALMRYLAVEGTQHEKFDRLQSVTLRSRSFVDCPNAWDAPLLPVQGQWTSLPMIDDLFPHRAPGIKTNRAWVHAPSLEILVDRWRAIVSAPPAEKRLLLKETRDRTIDKAFSRLPGQEIKQTLRAETNCEPHVVRFGFRSFDRQHLIADQRVVDFIRPDLWHIVGPQQVYLITQLLESLTAGPGVVFSALIPDMDHYRGHHGGRVIPQYRDAKAMAPNIAPKLLRLLRRLLGIRIADEDLMAYVAGAVAHAGYTERFRSDLRQPGVRVPLTREPALWRAAVELGRRIIWLHTYGERLVSPSTGRPSGTPKLGRPGVIVPVPGKPEGMPDSISYDASTRVLSVGDGRIGPVREAAWAYEVSGMRIIRHWFDYRRRNPKGRKGGSPLDEIVADRWALEMTEELRDLIAVLDGCVELEPEQANLLEQIVNGPLITVDDLEESGVLPVPPQARRPLPADDDTLF